MYLKDSMGVPSYAMLLIVESGCTGPVCEWFLYRDPHHHTPGFSSLIMRNSQQHRRVWHGRTTSLPTIKTTGLTMFHIVKFAREKRAIIRSTSHVK